MTKEEKQLLLKDLCARLMYWVKYKANIHGRESCIETMVAISYRKSKKHGYEGIFVNAESGGWDSIDDIKPYLRPMSSMTAEEKEELRNICSMYECDLDLNYESFGIEICSISRHGTYFESDYTVIDWLNAHHFDYRGLIEMGLAIAAPEEMYKTKEEKR